MVRAVSQGFAGRVPRSARRALNAGVACGLAFAAGCGGSDPVAWCAPQHDDVDIVGSSGAGVWAEREARPRLIELWRAGGVNEGEELAYPASVSASPGGRVAIVDFQLSEVIVVEPDGTWLGPWGRRGAGPGELGRPVAATWDRSGGLAVFDIAAPKVVFLEDGAPARPDVRVDPSFTAPVVASGQVPWAGVQPDGGALLQPAPEPVGDAPEAGLRTSLLLRLAPGGTDPDTLARATVRTVADGRFAGRPVPGTPRLVAAVGTDGSVAVGGTDPAYRITIFDAAGAPVRQICREAAPLPITDRERGVPGDGGGRGAASRAPPALAEAIRDAPPPDAPAAVGRLFRGTGGRLWVQRDRASPLEQADALFGPPGARYDVFAEDGRYLGEVRAPAAARLQAAAGDTVWALEFGNFDEAWVVAYEMVQD